MNGGGGHGGGGHSGREFHGGREFNRGGFFYGGYYPGFYAPGYYGAGYGYGRYGYGYGAGYFNDGYAVPTTVYVNPVVQVAPVLPEASMAPAQPSDQTAAIDVILPRPDAKVWVDGHPMTAGSGTHRTFSSPNLDPGYAYTYRLTATWLDNGHEVRAEKSIPVAPGRVSLADFSNVNAAPKMPPVQD